MRKLTKEQVDKILAEHKLWLDSNGREGKQADFSYTDCSWLDFSGANLRWIDCRNANFCRANFSGADFICANLSCANLSCADLSGADLRCADLSGADLRCADCLNTNFFRAKLSRANCVNADFNGATGNGKEIKTVQTDKYIITYTQDVMAIGCEQHAIKDWFNFSDNQIAAMDEGALEWWTVWKPIIKQILEANKCEKINLLQ